MTKSFHFPIEIETIIIIKGIVFMTRLFLAEFIKQNSFHGMIVFYSIQTNNKLRLHLKYLVI